MGLFRRIFWMLLELGLLPDFIIRYKIRSSMIAELAEREKGGVEGQSKRKNDFIEELRSMPIAVHQEDANQQHYEVPAALFKLKLGKRLKYSSCLWPEGTNDIDSAEEKMLELYVVRAQLKDGMTILDLGCGWGSLGLYLAERFPKSQVFTLSNSVSQREYVTATAKAKGMRNVTSFTGDIAAFDEQGFANKFDRILSVEMFEHMKNYGKLLAKLSKWLKDDGKLFVHIFTHTKFAYHFDKGWMARTFFSGGCMPSHDLLLHFQQDLKIDRTWMVNGQHYSRTLDAWLKRLDNNYKNVRPILDAVYGEENGRKWYFSWRMFYLVCSESFAFNGGNEYVVSHYLFAKQ